MQEYNVPAGISISVDEVGTPEGVQLLDVNQLVLVPPDQTLLVVKDEVLTLNEDVQLKLDEKAIAVILTTFEVPTELKAEVVNVPVPGLPAVKLIDAVVELTEFVPETL